MNTLRTSRSLPSALLFASLTLSAAGCGGGSVSNEASARRAYIALDPAIDRALSLGMDGFNAANSANIPPQSAMGTVNGTLTVTGQVDQGASVNKGMRLRLALVNYEDMVSDGDGGSTLAVRYNTVESELPSLVLNLRGIPTADLTGTLTGRFTMTGDLTGDVVLNLTLVGRTESAGTATTIRRVPGSTTITGTATSAYGTYMVNVTR